MDLPDFAFSSNHDKQLLQVVSQRLDMSVRAQPLWCCKLIECVRKVAVLAK